MLPIQQTIQFSEYSNLYDLIIPEDNLLRQINDLIDFTFIHSELVDKYCPNNGRMAECPIQMFKYLLLKTVYDTITIEAIGFTFFSGSSVSRLRFWM